MATKLLAIGTALPETRIPQERLRDFFQAQAGTDKLAARLIGAAFDSSGITARHSVMGDITSGAGLVTDEQSQLLSPSTGQRNAVYRREAPSLFAAAARDALKRAGVASDRVTHVVTASCTGFFAPGPEFRLIRDLGMPDSVERYHLGFMGCGAAIPALRAAKRICDAQPGATVVVACAELCSLHIRASSDPEQIVSSAVFADGAAAAVVTSAAHPAAGAVFEIGNFSTAVTAQGESEMDWSIGDQGFDMHLTAEVPKIIGREIAEVARAALPAGEDFNDVAAWAVHPGGKAILDRAERGLELAPDQLDHSRAVLREFGNMSSATVLFILQRLLADEALSDDSIIMGLAFGPGLTVETASFVKRTTPCR